MSSKMKRRTWFILDGGESGSNIVQGRQIAWALANGNYGRAVHIIHDTDVEGLRHIGKSDVVVFVKWIRSLSLLDDLRSRGAKVVLNSCCGEGHPIEYDTLERIDGLLVPNNVVAGSYASYSIPIVVMEHHASVQFCEKHEHQEFTFAYIGDDKNCQWGGDIVPPSARVTSPQEMVTRALFAACHFCVWRAETDEWLFRGGSKLMTAAACGANIVLSKSPTHLDVLGRDYPYYVPNDETVDDVRATIAYARDSFGTTDWRDGLVMMRELCQKYSLDNIATKYDRFLQRVEEL
jgi:hypothetical protein